MLRNTGSFIQEMVLKRDLAMNSCQAVLPTVTKEKVPSDRYALRTEQELFPARQILIEWSDRKIYFWSVTHSRYENSYYLQPVVLHEDLLWLPHTAEEVVLVWGEVSFIFAACSFFFSLHSHMHTLKQIAEAVNTRRARGSTSRQCIRFTPATRIVSR